MHQACTICPAGLDWLWRRARSLKHTRSKCGRGLAPDEGVSVNTSVTDPPPSGASPLPHWNPVHQAYTICPAGLDWLWRRTRSLKHTRSKCGRGLAPDEGVSVDTSVTDPPPSGASPLPHWNPVHQACTICPAGLDWLWRRTRSLKHTRSKCGRGLAPDEGVSVNTSVTDPPPSGASPLPHWNPVH